MSDSSRPNILLVQADQHRYDCVGVNGHDVVETPTLDRLAEEGTNFTNAFTPTPICSPERASLMTGRWPSGHGTHNLIGQPGGRPLDQRLVTFAQVASEAGYATRYVGRWHLGHEEDGGPEQFGFDQWISNDAYDDWRAAQGLPERPGPNAETGWFGQVDAGVEPEESRLAWGADRTIEQLEDLSTDDEPFLLRWDTFEPHLPNVVPEPYASMYDPDAIEPWGSFAEDLSNKPYPQQQVRRIWRLEGLTWEDWAPTVARYLGEITLLDHQLGRILERLAELGLAEDTVVIYTADHGDMCGAHGMIDKHFSMYDDIVRVPMFVRGPDIPADEENDAFVCHALDIAATICEMTAGEIPASFQGDSLLPLFRDDPGREEIYALFDGCQMGLYQSRMLRDDRYKYVWNLTARDELYDLEIDPHERENLVTDPTPETPAVLTEMRERLLAWIYDTNDTLANPWAAGQLSDEAWVWTSPGRGPLDN